MIRTAFGLLLIGTVCLPALAYAATVGVIDRFPGTTVAGWGGGTPASNPGTGGVGGIGDGYLRLASTFEGNFGTRSTSAAYVGNWTATGITEVSFYLNDVNGDETFSFRVLITDGLGNTWQYNTGFNPPNSSWQRYTVSLSNATDWTQTGGSPGAVFSASLQNVGRLHFRHDLPPYGQSPDAIAGTIGIDEIELGPDCDHNGVGDGLQPDGDDDGVIDACDTCPNTIAGVPVDATGCTPLIPGDFDRDGDVDLTDVGFFTGCAAGPEIPQEAASCEAAHFDADADVDMDDFAILQRCYRGEGVLGDPLCAD